MMKPTILLTCMLALATLFGAVAIAQDADDDDDDFEFVGQPDDGNETADENEIDEGNKTGQENRGDKGKGADKRDETGEERSSRSFFGLCTAWNASETGRENGNASKSSAFTWLMEQAGGAIDAFCDDVDHPSEQASGKADDASRGRPDHAPGGNAPGHERKAENGENGQGKGQVHGKGKSDDDESDE